MQSNQIVQFLREIPHIKQQDPVFWNLPHTFSAAEGQERTLLTNALINHLHNL